MKVILRSEYKETERRSPLIPSHAAKLVEAGYEVEVEKCSRRLFQESDYVAAGCKVIDSHAWKNLTPDSNTIILGLKELPLDFDSIAGKHIYFAHIFKGQENSLNCFQQLDKGNATLYDLEFLQNDQGRRVAAFGYWAGYVGAALSLWQFSLQQSKGNISKLQTYDSKNQLLDEIARSLGHCQILPKSMVIGAKGRCGAGATGLLSHFNCAITKWDVEETQKGGPFPEIINHELLINCVYLSKEIPPFIDKALVENNNSNLKVIGDVSCDPNGPWNPIRIYSQHTTWENPILKIPNTDTGVIAIDNLPSLLPKESSEDFSQQLLPYLMDLKEDKLGVWKRAETIFHENKAKYL